MAAALAPEVLSSIASAVDAGASVVGTIQNMVERTDRTVACGVEISNSTMYLLEAEGYYSSWGYVNDPPPSVNPGKKEAFVGFKNRSTTTGTTGVAVWKVGNTDTRLLVMWSIPWNHNHHSNVLALGLKEGKVKLKNKTYREMYYDSEPWFYRKEFFNDKHCTPVKITHKSHQFRVQGNMGTTHKTRAIVEFLPLVEGVIAPNLKNARFDCRAGVNPSRLQKKPISTPPQPEPPPTTLTLSPLGACVTTIAIVIIAILMLNLFRLVI